MEEAVIEQVTVEQLRQFAMDNYEDGGDFIVECWEDKDLEDFIRTHPTNTVEELKRVMYLMESQRRDIQATAF